MKSTPTVIFLHIPKTAGTSFNTALSWQYWGKPSYWIDTLDFQAEGFMQLPLQRRAKLRLLRGHMEFGLHEMFPQPAVYTTFIREPVARLFSYWQNQQNTARHHPEATHSWLEAARTMTFEQYIAFGKDINLDNNQVRRISGMNAPFGECNRMMLEKARSNMAKYFPVIGLTNRFDESLALMHRALGWKRPLFYSVAKVGENQKNRSDPSESLVKDIRRLNELDAELYTFAQERFENSVKDANGWIETDVQQIRRLATVSPWIIPLARRLRGRKP
jgi:hypothetical protein